MISHDDLVDTGRRWLERGPSLTSLGVGRSVLISTEAGAAQSEAPDVIGWDYLGNSVLIECKATRSDFRKDLDKSVRKHPEIGMGKLRFYLCPVGVIEPYEVPFRWGLLYAHERKRSDWPLKVSMQRMSEVFPEYNLRAQIELMVRLFRSLRFAEGDGVSIRAYEFYSRVKKGSVHVDRKSLP